MVTKNLDRVKSLLQNVTAEIFGTVYTIKAYHDKENEKVLQENGIEPRVYLQAHYESSCTDSGEVHILTGSTTIRALDELEELGFEKGVHFTHVQGLPDLLKSKGCEVVGISLDYGNEEYSTKDWNSAKAEYCRTNKIDLHLDDTVEYGETFTTPFARVWTKNK